MPLNTTQSPDSLLYRTVTADDSVIPTDKKYGLNCAQYDEISIEILPADGADPAVAVYVWSQTGSKFVQENPAFVKAALGADIGSAFLYPCKGRIIFIAITSGIGEGQSTVIATSGFPMAEGTG